MTPAALAPGLAAAAEALARGRHRDPFSVLGPHAAHGHGQLRAYLPGALAVEAVTAGGGRTPMREAAEGFFLADAPGLQPGCGPAYRLRVRWPRGEHEAADPYAFGPLLGAPDLDRLRAGTHPGLADCLGAHAVRVQETDGVRFAVWAPNAWRVSVVGNFNGWDGRRHVMRLRHDAGAWEIFIPGIGPGERYQYEIVAADGTLLPRKADPVARQSERPPATASIVADPQPHAWTDREWMAGRAARHAPDAALSIYEVHAGSWLGPPADDGRVWERLAARLVPYACALGFTHIELLPVMEHPFGGSWGYQPLGLFAPTARYGAPADFARFVDCCHRAGLGVILDWVPAHFPSDAHGIARFDGTALYEHGDPREGLHPDWNTLIYNLGRTEVRNFLMASALEWLRRYHIDGLRVDAVASMLYRDYSRRPGLWVPNLHGGRENLEAVSFLRELNAAVAAECPGAMTIAEESTAWPGVTAPAAQGGLGFTYKWNMGWMHDTLRYMGKDPVHRPHHHDDMMFGMAYAYSERFVLPLSHDEVVHGKGSLLARMPGDRWRKFANLRAYFGFMWAHPGRKLLFMGGEIAQAREWDHDGAVDWDACGDASHAGVQTLVADLNRCYRDRPALHRRDSDPSGFAWVVGDDRANSVFAFLRRDGENCMLAVANMTPVPRHGYRIGVPAAGRWRERINTDARAYGGSGMGNGGAADTEPVPAHGHAQSLALTLPPLATLLLEPER